MTLTYDLLNRLTNKTSGNDTDCVTQINANYTYDVGANGKGRRTKSENTIDNIVSEWTYDTRGHMKTETVMGYTTEWDYNAADLPIWMEYPDGEVVNYNYDSRMLLNSVIGTNTYVSSTTYDSAGRMDSRILGNNLTQNYDYYAWNEKATVDSQLVGQGGRLKNMTVGTLQNLNYLYDAVGNIKQITNPIASETNSYGYDELNRLTSWDLNGTTETYTYETATGNLDVKAGVDLNYNDAAHKHAVTHIGSTQKYWYDANGSQTTRVIGNDTYNLIYDAQNRLVEVKKNSSTMATFTYDGDGKQVKSVVNGVTTLFVGTHYQVEDGVDSKYYFAGMQRIAVRKNSTLSYLLSDHLGSTSITTDASGNLVSELRYKPWGETRYTSGITPTNYKYTGQRQESSFGLYFYNARWYDNTLGRFVQADTIIPGGGNSQAWDRYSYTFNNPIKYADSTGHEPRNCYTQGDCKDARDLTNWTVAAAVDIAESTEMKNIAELNNEGGTFNKGVAWGEFYSVVADGKKYDVKIEMKAQLGETIKLGSNWYEYSTAGNILFGFYGLAAGFSKEELKAGAGFAQLLDHFLDEDHPDTGGPLTLFDTEEDYYAVEFGFYLYENYYDDGELTKSEFLQALSEFEYADKLDFKPEPKDFRPKYDEYEADVFYQ